MIHYYREFGTNAGMEHILFSRANLERERHTQGWKTLYEELNCYSNYFSMDIPP